LGKRERGGKKAISMIVPYPFDDTRNREGKKKEGTKEQA